MTSLYFLYLLSRIYKNQFCFPTPAASLDLESGSMYFQFFGVNFIWSFLSTHRIGFLDLDLVESCPEWLRVGVWSCVACSVLGFDQMILILQFHSWLKSFGFRCCMLISSSLWFVFGFDLLLARLRVCGGTRSRVYRSLSSTPWSDRDLIFVLLPAGGLSTSSFVRLRIFRLSTWEHEVFCR